MPRPQPTDAQLRICISALHEHGSQSKAARALGVPVPTFKTRLDLARRRGLLVDALSAPPAPNPGEASYRENGETAEWDGVVSKPVRSLDELIKVAGIDTAVWDVERWSCTAWTTAMKLTTRAEGKITDESPRRVQNYRVSAVLKRKEPRELSLAALLKQIEQRAPMLPRIKRPKPRKLEPRRALELCVMDPHIGLLCSAPEADCDWDLDLAAGAIMQAIDDLIEKAQPHGPFEQVFIPFGNDFTHCDTVFHTTTGGTPQPEAMSWHRVYDYAEQVAIAMVERLRAVAPEVYVYEVPGNHSRVTDFTLARLLRARFHHNPEVRVDASSSPYKFHRYGVNLIGYEHGHSVKPIRLAALMANERPMDAAEARYKEWHLGDQHRKGSSKPSMLEEQGVSVEYIPGLTAPNEWHRLKSFNHQQRGAMAFVWDFHTGPVGRFQFNILKYQPEKR
jgi:hypothetical protein